MKEIITKTKNKIGGETIITRHSDCFTACDITDTDNRGIPVLSSSIIETSRQFTFHYPYNLGAHTVDLVMSDNSDVWYVWMEKLHSNNRELPDCIVKYHQKGNDEVNIIVDNEKHVFRANLGGQMTVEKNIGKGIKMVSRYEMGPEFNINEDIANTTIHYNMLMDFKNEWKPINNWDIGNFPLVSTEVMGLNESPQPDRSYNIGFIVYGCAFHANELHFLHHMAVAEVVFNNLRTGDYTHCELFNRPYFPYACDSIHPYGCSDFAKIIPDYKAYKMETAKKLLSSQHVKFGALDRKYMEAIAHGREF